MKLATARTATGTVAVRIEDGTAVVLDAPDVGALLARDDWPAYAAAHDGERLPTSGLDLAPVVPRPGKIVCAGLNYRNHILEMGRELPAHPALFAKFAETLIGPADDIAAPPESAALDWEAELAVVVGRPVRRADPAEALSAIAGYTVCNDVTARDWQYRTPQWLQGKTFEATTPLGPHLVTEDEIGEDVRAGLTLTAEVDGEQVQYASTADLVFGPADLVSYVSTTVTLQPGDVILTGTPGGVGHARTPQRYLTDGSKLVTRIEGLGELVNLVRR